MKKPLRACGTGKRESITAPRASVSPLEKALPLQGADKAHILYLTLLGGLIWAFRANLEAWGILVLLHLVSIAGIFALAVTWVRWPSSRLLAFVRTWYHLPVFLLLFEEVHLTVRMAVPVWMDAGLIRVENALFGLHPTVWLEGFSSIFVTEYMNFAYFSYFLLIPGAGLALRLNGHPEVLMRLICSCAVGYYICYVAFHLLPIEGPAHTLAHLQKVELQGGLFTHVVNWLESFGRIHGGAFPSAHVTAATIVLLFVFRYARKAVWIFGPLVVSLYVSTVYLRYHYASDVFGGIAVGLLAFALAEAGRKPRIQNPET